MQAVLILSSLTYILSKHQPRYWSTTSFKTELVNIKPCTSPCSCHNDISYKTRYLLKVICFLLGRVNWMEKALPKEQEWDQVSICIRICMWFISELSFQRDPLPCDVLIFPYKLLFHMSWAHTWGNNYSFTFNDFSSARHLFMKTTCRHQPSFMQEDLKQPVTLKQSLSVLESSKKKLNSIRTAILLAD